ncbi:putative secreted glycosidase [Hyphodiscus hymeniophilus]|uniref:Secreted glycosidase n=1 Tax=Hyphodiscus hymeniophilus TaxID=353542 RepID=A0A9P7AZJ2_9HELO|nr:putative secreted glycosidase [Hyphodiscus hymeniophilus]
MFIGTKNGGMAKASADCVGEAHGGFATDGSDISGFSHMHDSGTGGVSIICPFSKTISLGNFPLFPQYCPENNLTHCKFTKSQRRVPRGEYNASPGYFDITLADGIRGEATVTEHTALYRFTFPPNATSDGQTNSPVITIDLNDLANTRVGNAAVSVDSKTGRVSGNGTFRPSFGTGRYDLHFCTDFKGGKINEAAIWDRGIPDSRVRDKAFGGHLGGGAYVQFDPSRKEILVRVGLSFMNTSQACQNAESEIPSFDFPAVKRSAEVAWAKKLDVISVVPGGIDNNLKIIFWSGFYRTMISPQDYTNENPLWNSTEPYFDSFYCIWDSFRSQHPFLTLVDPIEQSRMVRALIDIYVHEGKLPDCRMSLCKGLTQGGSNADVVLADAMIKNLGGSIDWDLAYEAVVSDAEEELSSWDHSGRGGLQSWKTLNFIPIHDNDTDGYGMKTRSVSRTVEFAYNDFCIALMAEKMGRLDDATKYFSRAGNWRSLYNADQNSSINGIDTGFVGFLQPRQKDLTWAFQDPANCSPLLNMDSCYLDGGGGETYEGSCWMYTFFVPQDMASLIATLGGPVSFISRLDFLHQSGLLYMGDEQAFLTVFLYHYAGRPALSSQRAHAYIPSQFNNTDNGIPGNDDSGAMGSFVTLTMMGVFPNPGQDVYFITPPFFEEVSVVNGETGKKATIRNVNFDPEYKRIYVQEARRDGKPWTKNWIDHSFFKDGGVLELVLGDKESDWGTKDADLPPSMSTRGKR